MIGRAAIAGLALLAALLHAPIVDARTPHPAIRLLDADGRSVLDSGQPVATMTTCNGCHAVDYIAAHCRHMELDGGDLDPTGARRVGGGAGGKAELNCFLCHLNTPDDQSRRDALRESQAAWAATATLAATGLVERQEGVWKYRRDAFRTNGDADPQRLAIRPPSSENCGACHGQTHRSEEPLRLEASLRHWNTAATGAVFSPQRIAESAANLSDKQRWTQSWDVHAERLLECRHCHFSLNHPAYYEPSPLGRPEHLRFEPRRMAIEEYLARPSHQFAVGEPAQATAPSHLNGTMRRCADCHDPAAAHAWLPYREAHFRKLSCQTCHIPRTFAPALRVIDWSVTGSDGQPRLEWRGVEGDPAAADALISGSRPALLPRRDLDGQERLYPYNLVMQWQWVEGRGSEPAPLGAVQAALTQNGHWHPAVLAALDVNLDGALTPGERRLDSPAKVQVIRGRLAAVGVGAPRLAARIEPYALQHGVGPGRTATRECRECHGRDSRLAEPITLTAAAPDGLAAEPASGLNVMVNGAVERDPTGRLVWRPAARAASTYVFGRDYYTAIDLFGGLAVLGAIGAAGAHAGLRIAAARKAVKNQGAPRP